MPEVIKIVDRGTFEKGIKLFEYLLPIKDRSFFIYSYPGDDIVLINVSRENSSSKLFITMYFKDSERPTITNKMDEGIISYFRDFIGKADYAYDVKRQAFVFNITTGEELGIPFYSNFDYRIKCKYFLANYMEVTKEKVERKLTLIKNTEEILPVLIYKSVTQHLLEPEQLEEFGCRAVFEVSNSLKVIPHKMDKWFRYSNYAVPFRKKSLLATYPHMDKLVKVIDEARVDFELDKIPKENKPSEEKAIVVVNDYENITLSSLLVTFPFTAKMIPVIIDIYKEEFQIVSSAYILRGKLHLYTDIFEIMKGDSYDIYLAKYEKITGLRNITLGYSNREGELIT